MAKQSRSFNSFVTKERNRLKKTKAGALSRKAEIEKELQGIERELRALDAYQAAKIGSFPSRGKRKRGRRGGKRDEVLKIISRNPSGLSRGDIIKKLSLKGNKSGEQSVSNVLTALKKSKQLTSKDGKYVAV